MQFLYPVPAVHGAAAGLPSVVCGAAVSDARARA